MKIFKIIFSLFMLFFSASNFAESKERMCEIELNSCIQESDSYTYQHRYCGNQMGFAARACYDKYSLGSDDYEICTANLQINLVNCLQDENLPLIFENMCQRGFDRCNSRNWSN